jgi:hypothetical protein
MCALIVRVLVRKCPQANLDPGKAMKLRVRSKARPEVQGNNSVRCIHGGEFRNRRFYFSSYGTAIIWEIAIYFSQAWSLGNTNKSCCPSSILSCPTVSTFALDDQLCHVNVVMTGSLKSPFCNPRLWRTVAPLPFRCGQSLHLPQRLLEWTMVPAKEMWTLP